MIFHLIILSLVLVLVFLIYWHYDNIFPTGETEPKLISPKLDSVKSSPKSKNVSKKNTIINDKLAFIDTESEAESERDINSINSEYFNEFVKINENTQDSQDSQESNNTNELYNPNDETDKSNQTLE